MWFSVSLESLGWDNAIRVMVKPALLEYCLKVCNLTTFCLGWFQSGGFYWSVLPGT